MEENSTTNITMNDTIYGSLDWEKNVPDQCLRFSYTVIAFSGVCLVISICGLVGNGVVMWFLGFQTKQSPFTVYLLNLAVTDFSLLLMFFLVFSEILAWIAFCTSLFPFIGPYYVPIFNLAFLCLLFDLSSLGLLTALSVERCVSVLCPIWYRCHRPRHLSGLVSGALWAFSGVLILSLYVTYTCTENTENVIAFIALAISMAYSLLMVLSNLFLFLKLCCGSRWQQPGKLFVAILINVLVFFAFGIPYCMEVFFDLPSSKDLYPHKHTFLLAILNSSLNPVIYVLVGSWRRRRFQLSIRVALRRVFEEKARSDEGSHIPGDTAVEMRAL